MNKHSQYLFSLTVLAALQNVHTNKREFIFWHMTLSRHTYTASIFCVFLRLCTFIFLSFSLLSTKHIFDVHRTAINPSQVANYVHFKNEYSHISSFRVNWIAVER